MPVDFHLFDEQGHIVVRPIHIVTLHLLLRHGAEFDVRLRAEGAAFRKEVPHAIASPEEGGGAGDGDATEARGEQRRSSRTPAPLEVAGGREVDGELVGLGLRFRGRELEGGEGFVGEGVEGTRLVLEGEDFAPRVELVEEEGRVDGEEDCEDC